MEENDLTFENILQREEQSANAESNSENKDKETKEKEENNQELKTTEGLPFLNTPESVGSEEKDEDKDTPSDKNGSPTLFSSIAKTLQEEGVLSYLEENDVKDIDSAEKLVQLFEKDINARFDQKQKRINDALDANLPSDEIKQYENTISYLDNIDISDLEKEESEELRKQLITQDLINRGISQERIKRTVEKSIESGSDIEDAKDALTGCREFFNKLYTDKINEGKETAAAQQKKIDEQASKLKKAVLDTEEVFGVSVDKPTRNKILKNVSEATYKDENGNFYTALQKAQLDDPIGFMHKLGLIFTITDGFKDMNKLVSVQVKKETRKSLKEFEASLLQSQGLSDGGLKAMGGGSKDKSPDISSLRLNFG